MPHREIRFRAWIRQGEWDEAGENQAYVMCYDLAFEEFEPLNDLLATVGHLMQFTGLLDKNDKPVYESDIILRDGDKYVVAWHTNKAGWYMRPLHTNGWHGVNASDMALMCKVIGNVYEHPSLSEREVI